MCNVNEKLKLQSTGTSAEYWIYECHLYEELGCVDTLGTLSLFDSEQEMYGQANCDLCDLARKGGYLYTDWPYVAPSVATSGAPTDLVIVDHTPKRNVPIQYTSPSGTTYKARLYIFDIDDRGTTVERGIGLPVEDFGGETPTTVTWVTNTNSSEPKVHKVNMDSHEYKVIAPQ